MTATEPKDKTLSVAGSTYRTLKKIATDRRWTIKTTIDEAARALAKQEMARNTPIQGQTN